jgi:ABC-type nickel/cobalt efflux system permease component RcnA
MLCSLTGMHRLRMIHGLMVMVRACLSEQLQTGTRTLILCNMLGTAIEVSVVAELPWLVQGLASLMAISFWHT